MAMTVAAVAAAVIALRVSDLSAGTYPVQLQGYALTDEPLRLTVQIETFQSAQIVDIDVGEESNRVIITIHARVNPNTFDFTTYRTVAVSLRTPLGTRVVVDGSRGTEVRRQ